MHTPLRPATGSAGPVNSKLVRAKEQWARDGRLLTGEGPADPRTRRLPPGQRLVTNWPVLDLGTQPNLSVRDWTLGVSGRVGRALRLDHADLLALPQTTLMVDIHCVTQWSRYDTPFSGVTGRRLLAEAAPMRDARFVLFKGYDGYMTSLPIEHVDRDDVLVAHSADGGPLSRAHGGPVRVVVPHLYFWKSAKWIRHITLLDKDYRGYWELRGYHDLGEVIPEIWTVC